MFWVRGKFKQNTKRIEVVFGCELLRTVMVVIILTQKVI